MALSSRSIKKLLHDHFRGNRPMQVETTAREAMQVIVSGRGGTNFTPVIDFLDAHRDYDGAIIFTDGHAPIPRMPQNRRTRVLWLFNTEATYRAMHPALRAIGRAAFLREV